MTTASAARASRVCIICVFGNAGAPTLRGSSGSRRRSDDHRDRRERHGAAGEQIARLAQRQPTRDDVSKTRRVADEKWRQAERPGEPTSRRDYRLNPVASPRTLRWASEKPDPPFRNDHAPCPCVAVWARESSATAAGFSARQSTHLRAGAFFLRNNPGCVHGASLATGQTVAAAATARRVPRAAIAVRPCVVRGETAPRCAPRAAHGDPQ